MSTFLFSIKQIRLRRSRQPGRKILLVSGAPVGDAMVHIDGLDTPVAPGSTIGGVMIINSLKAELAKLLTDAGHPPKVLTASVIAGEKRAVELFESAYDEHAHRLAKLFENIEKK